jgi:acrylyl-CoA reductase (NADPH)
MSTFRAYRLFDEGATIGGHVVDATLDELSAGDVIIKAAYSSVNYKDALASTGAGKIEPRRAFSGRRSGARHRLRPRRRA